MGDVISGVGLGLVGWGYRAWTPTARWKYFAQVFSDK